MMVEDTGLPHENLQLASQRPNSKNFDYGEAVGFLLFLTRHAVAVAVLVAAVAIFATCCC